MKNKLFYIILIFSLLLNIFLGFLCRKQITSKVKAVFKTEAISDHKNKTEMLKDLVFYDGKKMSVYGRYHDENNFNRLPAAFQKSVRAEVWDISKNSAGLSIRFTTNSPVIGAKWTVLNHSSIGNMTQITSSGIDLYCMMNGKWQYVNSGIPSGKVNESLLISEMDATTKEFMIHLPLYDGIEQIEIGIQKGFSLTSSPDTKPNKPIVFYGTSITQGGSASRPGMAYPSIIGRNLKTEIINLGLNGNGRFEQSIGAALCEIDAQLFVIDCTPNSHPDTIKNNALNLMKQIRKCRPESPILLIESITRENAYLKTSDPTSFGSYPFILAQNKALQKAYDQAIINGVTELYYLKGDGLIGSDHEATVDGTHLTDLGHYRMAQAVETKIKEILKLK
jgi:GDSL-like Lipase/Acylhydrolase family/N-terminus of Esterase_SGNH_hydro-type